MIDIAYESTPDLNLSEETIGTWISKVVEREQREMSDIALIFCDDEYLHKINVDYLDHDTLTDIISFDYTEGNLLQGDIFVSVERVKENALDFKVPFEDEIKRVLSHGILHYCGYKDKSPEDELLMRSKEDEKIQMFHVEQ